LARASLAEGRSETAISAYHAVLHACEPDSADLSGMAQALWASGRPVEAEACQSAAEDLAPDDYALGSRRLARLALDPDSSAEAMAAAHAAWSRRHAAPIRAHADVAPRRPDPERPLRVAYLSGAFHGCDMAEHFAPVLQGHRRAAIEPYCYNVGTQVDAVTETLTQAAAKWTDITRVDEETVWEILRGDEIDIAVDLSGHFDGGRPLVFARRPAPVTLAWLGYPYPPGVPALDYVLTDAVACPEDASAPATGEGIWRLSRAPFAYRPPMHIPAVGELPGLHARHVTFGASGDLAAITPARAQIWAGLLRQIAEARLLVCNRFDQDQACIERINELFSHFGLRDRVDVVNMTDNFRSGFEFYHHVDLALDSGTVGALTENCRALWMGVPVLSLVGQHQAVRQGASLLQAAGRFEWCAASPEGLADAARLLVADLGRLAALRAELRVAVAASPLGDVDGLVRDIEQTYRDMWRQRCRGVSSSVD
jgi:predicted O-linked N-acetylglucosamine transferase (SPINDLY family)